jgi:hypothetical protein
VAVNRILFSEYWLSMLIGSYYDKLNRVYVIFSLPCEFSDYFMTTTDIMSTQFNQTGYQLNDLVPMLFAKARRISVQIGRNEKLSSSFVALLKQGNYRGKQFLIGSYQCLFFLKSKIISKNRTSNTYSTSRSLSTGTR